MNMWNINYSITRQYCDSSWINYTWIKQILEANDKFAFPETTPYLHTSSQLQLGGWGFCNMWRRNLSISIISKCPYWAATARGVVSSGKSGLWVTPAYSKPGVNSFSLFNINTVILTWLSLIACRCVSVGSMSGWDNKYSTIAAFLSFTAIWSALIPWKMID